MEMLNPLAIQKQSLFPVPGENSGIASLPPLSRRIQPITPPATIQVPRDEVGSLATIGGEFDNLNYGRRPNNPTLKPDFELPTTLQQADPNNLLTGATRPIGNGTGIMQNTNNIDNLNLMVDNILKQRLKEFFGGIMSMFDV